MKILLSIKPEYAERIFNGTKKYEFRRTIFKNPDVKTVVVYASSPIQEVIGEFEIEKVLNLELDNLWYKTREFAGISEQKFFAYFKSKIMGYAIKIKTTKRYRKALSLKNDLKLSPPQSFIYLEDGLLPN